MPTMPVPYRNLPAQEVINAARQKTTFGGEVHAFGGADPSAANIPRSKLDPSVQHFNEVQKDRAKHVIGYATFLGTVSETEDGIKIRNTVHDQFIDATGHRRVFMQYQSEPIYYDADLKLMQEMANGPEPSWLVTQKPVNAQSIRAKFRLSEKSHMELVNMAKHSYPNVIKNPDTLVKEELIEALLAAQFPSK